MSFKTSVLVVLSSYFSVSMIAIELFIKHLKMSDAQQYLLVIQVAQTKIRIGRYEISESYQFKVKERAHQH